MNPPFSHVFEVLNVKMYELSFSEVTGVPNMIEL